MCNDLFRLCCEGDSCSRLGVLVRSTTSGFGEVIFWLGGREVSVLTFGGRAVCSFVVPLSHHC